MEPEFKFKDERIKLGELDSDTDRLFIVLMEKDMRIAKTRQAIEKKYDEAVKNQRNAKHDCFNVLRVYYSGMAKAYENALDIFSTRLYVPFLSESLKEELEKEGEGRAESPANP